jgi:hypothetical protein
VGWLARTEDGGGAIRDQGVGGKPVRLIECGWPRKLGWCGGKGSRGVGSRYYNICMVGTGRRGPCAAVVFQQT